MGKRGNGEGTILKVREGRWEGRIVVGKTDDGKYIRRKVVAPTRNELTNRMRQAVTDADAGITPVRRDLSVEAFLKDWLDNVLPGTVRDVTAAQYRQVVTLYINPRIGRKKLRTLTASDVSSMLRDMAKPTEGRPEGYSHTARRLARSVLRRAIRYAEQQGLVQRNVAAIAAGPTKEQTEGRAMTPAEVTKFVAAVRGDRLEAAFVMALGCGLRVSELGGLAWSDVTFGKKAGEPTTITIRHGLKRIVGTGLVCENVKTARSRRTLVLPRPVDDALRAHKKRQAAERLALGDRWPEAPLGRDLVFRTVRGKPLDAGKFWRALNAITDKAEIGHWNPHALRHSAASMLFAQNVPLKVISETLGHTTTAITADIYTHLLEASRQQAADAMTTALSG